MSRKIAYVISRVLGPFPLFLVSNLVIALRAEVPLSTAVWLYPILAAVGTVIPFGILTWLQVHFKVSDLDWTNLNKRKIAIVVLSFFWIINTILIRQFVGSTSTLYHIVQLFMFVAFLIFGITVFLKFKISNHAAAASAAFWAINFMFHFQFRWLFILLIPIVWSRYILKLHTALEIIAGLLLSNGIIILAVLIFGWPQVP